ncbi:MAG TPA: polysaccharide biosynthesis/export family protein [Paludibacter sp.]
MKNIAYFQRLNGSDQLTQDNKTAGSNAQSKNSNNLYEARIKPKDILSITVVSSEPEASRMYNLVVPQVAQSSYQTQLMSEPALQTYLVDNDGNIEFPVFGEIKVKGLTRRELEQVLHNKLASAFSKEIPIVTIRFENYSVNILGEVQSPGKYETKNDRLTIFDGLALAGDLTIYGRRDNVKVLRERVDGSKMYITVNLNDRNIIFSPAYYLEQNDVVYIEPNKSKSRSSNYGAAETFGISSLSVLLTLTSLIFTLVK